MHHTKELHHVMKILCNALWQTLTTELKTHGISVNDVTRILLVSHKRQGFIEPEK